MCELMVTKRGRITTLNIDTITSMADPHKACIRLWLIPHNYNDKISIISSITTGVILKTSKQSHQKKNLFLNKE